MKQVNNSDIFKLSIIFECSDLYVMLNTGEYRIIEDRDMLDEYYLMNAAIYEAEEDDDQYVKTHKMDR